MEIIVFPLPDRLRALESEIYGLEKCGNENPTKVEEIYYYVYIYKLGYTKFWLNRWCDSARALRCSMLHPLLRQDSYLSSARQCACVRVCLRLCRFARCVFLFHLRYVHITRVFAISLSIPSFVFGQVFFSSLSILDVLETIRHRHKSYKNG